jgi:hypothetical protein
MAVAGWASGLKIAGALHLFSVYLHEGGIRLGFNRCHTEDAF